MIPPYRRTHSKLTEIKKSAPDRHKVLLRTDIGSAVPPLFRSEICTLSIRDISADIRYCFPRNGGKFRWSLLGISLSVHSSEATSIRPSRRFPPAIFSLCFRSACTPPRQRHFACVRFLYFNYNNAIFYGCQPPSPHYQLRGPYL